ncbi:MAG: UxaA family hydrolase [Thaumarchaeota archaeon]|jgi:altronate dehydratase|nr:UxaA family hydrolase [Nitrososphaerota archaeon]MCL7386313.1 UxaA family hydrolase [Candidatus Wolframiiraptor allenii]
MKRAITLSEKDNVAVALEEILEGEDVEVTIGGEKIILKALNNIPFGHKISLRRIRRGEKIIKYGEPIGEAVTDIEQGEHVHVHNIKSIFV